MAVFPPGLPNRNYVTREMAASTVLTMLYLGAVEGLDYYLKPDQVTRMDDLQAERTSDRDRLAWRTSSIQPGGRAGWYAKNTREPIRDETIRQGLIYYGAAFEAENLPTTSPKGRYALYADFVELFDPYLVGEALATKTQTWRNAHLSQESLARIKILENVAVSRSDAVIVRFPNGESRLMSPGRSSDITKAVVERFATRFLRNPGVLWLSESGQRETYRDVRLLQALGINIETDRLLPDVMLVDLGGREDPPFFVFVEVVATDGPITEARKQALLRLATDAGYHADNVAFVNAYLDPETSAYRRTNATLAWGTFVWFLTHEDRLIALNRQREGLHLRDFHSIVE